MGLVAGACSADGKGSESEGRQLQDGEENPGLVGEDSNGDGNGDGIGQACLGETRAAEAIDLDIFIMLDSSASMLDALPRTLLSAPASKWDAVRASLEAFVDAPETAEIGIGLQYFPQVRDGVPFECETSAECGAGGPCSNTACVVIETQPAQGNVPALSFVRIPGDEPVLCSTNADCSQGGGTCRRILGQCIVPPGVLQAVPDGSFVNVGQPGGPDVVPLCSAQSECAGLPGTLCEPVGVCDDLATPCTPTLACPPGRGTCSGVPNTCVNQTQCDVAEYSSADVPITVGAERAPEIVASLRAKVPNGRTPTAPALSGGLAQAQAWAEANPGHQVVMVLATDGFPTECEPTEISDLAAIAREALDAERSVKTFVIGVFSDLDLGQDGQARLDALARAGGTGRAFVVNTGSSNVTESFLNALNVIRTSAIGCEFRLDADAALDYDRVNLKVTSAEGNERQLYNVASAADCASDDQGWYYAQDAAGNRAQINVCPGACAGFKEGGVRVDLQIGCATLIR